MPLTLPLLLPVPPGRARDPAHPDRAVDLLLPRLGWLDELHTPSARMWFAATAAHVLDRADVVGLAPADVDWVVPHQANARIIDATARKLGLSPDKVVMTVDRHANTSAASVPLALDVAVKDGRIKPGDLVVLEAMGGGFTWGAAVLRV